MHTNKSSRIFITVSLLIVLFVSYFDSHGIDGIVPLIQDHFKVNDAQTAIIRTSSSITHTISLALIWILGDVFDRKNFFLISAITWIGCSLLSVFLAADSFVIFIVFRSLGAAASSVFGVIVPVMLADLFKDRALGVALMCMTACEAVSGLFTEILSSMIVSSNWPWQSGLIIGPLVTIIPLTGLLFSKNRSIHTIPSDRRMNIKRSLPKAFRLFSITSFVLMTVRISMEMFYGRALTFWYPSYILSAFDAYPGSFNMISYTTFTTLKSLASMIGTFSGLPAILWFAQSWYHAAGPFHGREGNPRAYPIVVSIGTVVYATMVIASVLLLVESSIASLVATFLTGVGSAAIISLNQQMVLMVVPSSSRAAAVALSRLFSGIVSTPSAQLIGVITDAIRGDSMLPCNRYHAYQMGLLFTSAVMIAVFVCNLVIIMYFPRDCEFVEEREKEEKTAENEHSPLFETGKGRESRYSNQLSNEDHPQ